MSHGVSNGKSDFKDAAIDFTAGSLGGVALVYVGQPLDTVKVKMQTFPQLYKGMADCFIKTFRTDGIVRGLYAGTIPAVASNVTENSVLFLFYGVCQKFILNVTRTNSVTELSSLQNATAGFLAAFFSSIAICPAELIKCKIQAMYEVNKAKEKMGLHVDRLGTTQLMAQIYRADGPAGFFRGLFPTLLREMPGYFFFFGGYEGTRELLKKPGQSKDDIGLWKTMVAGGIGGSAFWVSVFPFDVVKSRVQVSSLKQNTFKCIYEIAQIEGFRALYKGLIPTLLRTIPATACLFATYEYSKKFMHYIFRDF